VSNVEMSASITRTSIARNVREHAKPVRKNVGRWQRNQLRQLGSGGMKTATGLPVAGSLIADFLE